MVPRLDSLRTKIFTDGADKAQIAAMARLDWISGFTTNPSLLKKAGVNDYASYAMELVTMVRGRHVSFEVISDSVEEMAAQARLISSWGESVYAKIPVSTTRGEPMYNTAHQLSREGIKINMTAVFSPEQVENAVDALSGGAPACVSVFAGRLGDAGIDYRPIIADAVTRARRTPNVEIIWASTREVFNVVEADNLGCHIITAPTDVLSKLRDLGRNSSAELSLSAVKAFRDDAVAAGITLPSISS